MILAQRRQPLLRLKENGTHLSTKSHPQRDSCLSLRRRGMGWLGCWGVLEVGRWVAYNGLLASVTLIFSFPTTRSFELMSSVF